MAAREIAMDELAVALNLDPLRLRVRNHVGLDPTRRVPFSSKRLLDCYTRGASGSDGRHATRCRSPCARGATSSAGEWPPRQCPAPRVGAAARVTIDQHGDVLVETGTQEIGTGVHAILPQIVADALGVDPARARVGSNP